MKYHQREFNQLSARHKAMSHREFVRFMRNAQAEGYMPIPLRAEQLIEEHAAYKAAQHARGRRKVSDTSWARRIHVLHDEMRSVRSGLRYQQNNNIPNPALHDALAAYFTVLQKALKRMNSARQWAALHRLPYGACIRDLNSQLPPATHITNSGQHWFDFVPPHAQAAVRAAFQAAAAHKTKKARFRAPFTRTLPTKWTAERFHEDDPKGSSNIPTVTTPLEGDEDDDT